MHLDGGFEPSFEALNGLQVCRIERQPLRLSDSRRQGVWIDDPERMACPFRIEGRVAVLFPDPLGPAKIKNCGWRSLGGDGTLCLGLPAARAGHVALEHDQELLAEVWAGGVQHIPLLTASVGPAYVPVLRLWRSLRTL